jgi:hypothetical protein
MKTISICTVTLVAALVVLRMNGVQTDVPELDVMVRLLMESMFLA